MEQPTPVVAVPDVPSHNAEVARLWEAYGQGTNERVPVTVAFDEQFLLPLQGRSFRGYYTNSEVQLDVQLRNQEWIRTHVVHDAPLGLPDEWWVAPAGWMHENEFYGAEVRLQDNDYAWGLPIELPKRKLIEHLRGLDAEERIRAGAFYRHWEELRALADGREHLGRPVRVVSPPVTSTHGIFTKAAEVRGLERICIDLADDPAFVHDLLAAVTDLTIERIKCWHRLAGSETTFPIAGGWGICDDSLTLLSEKHYAEFVLPQHERLYSAMTMGPRSIHLCGHVQHLFATLHRHLGITTFDGPGTQVDLVRMVRDIDAPITIQAQVSHAFLGRGHGEIEAAVRHVLQDEAKRRARMTLIGYASRGATMDNLRFFYECAVRHGAVDRGSGLP